VLFWICRYRQLDVTKQEQRQRLIDGFVNAIYLYDDKVVFSFNYKDGTKTVAFDEVKGAVEGSDMCAAGAPLRL